MSFHVTNSRTLLYITQYTHTLFLGRSSEQMSIYVSYMYISHITVCTVHTHIHIANKYLFISHTYTCHTSHIHMTYTYQNTYHSHRNHRTHTYSHMAQLREPYIILRRSSEHIPLYISSTRILLDVTQHIHTLFSGALANTCLCISLYIPVYLKYPLSPGCHTTHTYKILIRSSEHKSLYIPSTRILLYVTQHTHSYLGGSSKHTSF